MVGGTLETSPRVSLSASMRVSITCVALRHGVWVSLNSTLSSPVYLGSVLQRVAWHVEHAESTISSSVRSGRFRHLLGGGGVTLGAPHFRLDVTAWRWACQSLWIRCTSSWALGSLMMLAHLPIISRAMSVSLSAASRIWLILLYCTGLTEKKYRSAISNRTAGQVAPACPSLMCFVRPEGFFLSRHVGHSGHTTLCHPWWVFMCSVKAVLLVSGCLHSSQWPPGPGAVPTMTGKDGKVPLFLNWYWTKLVIMMKCIYIG